MLPVATMVNSQTDEAMVERIDQIEKKLDGLAASVERRFEAVDAAFLEQRQYTEFAFSRLETKMDARFDRVDARFGNVDARFDKVDARFDRLERKLDNFIERQGEANEAQRQMNEAQRKMNEAQRHANQLVERRLNRLE